MVWVALGLTGDKDLDVRRGHPHDQACWNVTDLGHQVYDGLPACQHVLIDLPDAGYARDLLLVILQKLASIVMAKVR